jgi:hypothetical protein
LYFTSKFDDISLSRPVQPRVQQVPGSLSPGGKVALPPPAYCRPNTPPTPPPYAFVAQYLIKSMTIDVVMYWFNIGLIFVTIKCLPYTGSLFYLTNIVCHFPPSLRRACGRWDEWFTLIRQASRQEVAAYGCQIK